MRKGLWVVFWATILTGLCSGQEANKAPLTAARLRAESGLSALPDQIKHIDEPALRVFLRIKLAKFLWGLKTEAGNEKAEAIATDAASDLKIHESELPKLHADVFRRELKAALRIHAPDLATQLSEKGLFKSPDNSEDDEDSETALAQLDAKKVEAAEKTIRQSLTKGKQIDLDLIWVLGDIARGYPDRLPLLLTEILNAAERNPERFSLETLYWLQRYYLGNAVIDGVQMKDNVPAALKVNWFRFIQYKIGSLSVTPAWGKQARPESAYQMLAEIMVESKKLDQELYPQISALAASVGGSIPPNARDEIDGRIRNSQSIEPISNSISQANASKTQSQKDELTLRAADQAARKGDLGKALELAAEARTDEKIMVMFRDQIYGDIVDKALQQKEPTLAGRAATGIKRLRERAGALQKIALYFLESNDLQRAREVLSETVQQVESSGDNTDRARGFLSLAGTYIKADRVRVPEMLQSAIKAINNLPSPKYDLQVKLNREEKEKYEDQVKRLIWVSMDIIPVFSEWGQVDEIGAFSLTQDIKNQGVREAANFGICVGLLKEVEKEAKDSTTQKN
jgi:hypothetical protein